MRRSSSIAILALLAVTACAAHRAPVSRDAAHRGPDPQEMSGFLDDYSMLRPGGTDELALVYRNPDAQWTRYRKVILEPVTLWRSGKHSLDAISETDLLRLVSDFERAVRRRLGKGFELVSDPSPGTLRLRLGITEARASDPVLDVLAATAEREPARAESDLSPELRAFIAAAAIEGEIRDAETDVLLAQGLDRRRKNAPPIVTWAQLDRALEFWVDRTCSRLEARTGPR